MILAKADPLPQAPRNEIHRIVHWALFPAERRGRVATRYPDEMFGEGELTELETIRMAESQRWRSTRITEQCGSEPKAEYCAGDGTDGGSANAESQ
jgi:hypothetical protein